MEAGKPGTIRYKKLLQYGLAVACLGYIIKFLIANRDSFSHVLSLNLSSVLGMACLFLLAIGTQCFRYRIVIGKFSGKRLPYFSWFRIFVLGTFLNRIFPQAGNVYRGVSLKQQFDVSYTRYISSYVGFLWLDTTLSIAIALLVVLSAERSLRIGPVPAWQVIGLLLVLAAAIPFVLCGISTLFKGRIGYFVWLQDKLAEVLTVTADSVRDGAYVVKILATGLVSFAITITTFYVCFRGLGVEVTWSMLAVFCVVMRLSNQLILTPGNLGVRELAYGILGKLAGVGMAEALLASIILRIIGTMLIFALGAAFGGVDLLKKRRQYISVPRKAQ